jgi:hypothetical protein
MSINKQMLIGLMIISVHLGHSCAKADSLHFFTPSSTTVTTYQYEPIGVMDVCLDMGYFINVRDTDDIEVSQSTMHGGNPFTTYYGCGEMEVYATFPIMLKTTVTPTSLAGGNWSATLNNQSTLALPIGATSVAVCVLGMEVQTHQLITHQAQENVPVAEVTIQVIPQ